MVAKVHHVTGVNCLENTQSFWMAIHILPLSSPVQQRVSKLE